MVKRLGWVAAVVLVVSCGTSTDDVAVTAPEPETGIQETTTSTGPIETTTTTTTVVETTTTTIAPTVIEVTVAEGSVEGGGDVSVAVGEQVTLRVTADVTDQVHVHGYELIADVAPDAPAEIVFTADVPGIFEIELEGAGLVLVDLEVGA